MHEAERLQADLRRAGIEPFAWVVNQSLAASDVTDPVLVQRARAEAPLIERVRAELAARIGRRAPAGGMPRWTRAAPRDARAGTPHPLEDSRCLSR